MLTYTIRRLLLAIPTLIGISIITFAITRLAPGDPAEAQAAGIMDQRVSQRVIETIKERFHLDKPLPEQYWIWIKNMVTLDFGNAMSTDERPVIDKISERLWPTMSLALLSLAIALALSIPIGITAAARQNGWFDTVSSSVLYALYSVPSYVMAMILILFLGVKWDLLPFRGMQSDHYNQLTAWGQFVDTFKHYLMITFCFSFGTWAYYSRFIRQNMLEVLRQDYIRTARAKGQRESIVIVKHAFRNTLIPVMTLLGMLLPEIIGGSVILEYMFNWPGLGRLFFESITARDYNTIMAMTMITAVLVLAGILLADLSYALVDPRVSHD